MDHQSDSQKNERRESNTDAPHAKETNVEQSIIYQQTTPVLNEKELTILILSESGAGKSAWINGTLKYVSLINERSSNPGDKSTIIVMDDTNKLFSQLSMNAENCSKEDQRKGQHFKWNFLYKSYAITLVDTPTLCTESGIEQYQKNLVKTLSTASNSIKQINGVCIFLKTNGSRLVNKIHDVIKKISSSLQNDFTKNIAFCLAKTRTYFYGLGNFKKSLIDVLNTPQMNIPLDESRVYCFENEWIKLLHATNEKNNQERIPKDRESIYLYSFQKSVAEIDRLFKDISEMQPFLMQFALDQKDCSYNEVVCGNINNDSAKPKHFAKSKIRMSPTYISSDNRAFLSIACPSELCAQTSKASGNMKLPTDTEHQWFCPNCKEKVQFGFDGNFYCLCGSALIDTYKFKCPYSDHNKYEEHYNLKELLRKLIPFEKINILILSESGVGKSVWINGFVNYLAYFSIKEHELGSPNNVKPFFINLTDKEVNEIAVNIQTETSNKQKSEQSSYQICKPYSFPFNNNLISLIDAPKALEKKDIRRKQYITRILNIITTLKKVNGICFLMKPKKSNLINEVHNIVTELQKAFSDDLCKNVMFCFTNSRTYFYSSENYAKYLKENFSKYPTNNIPIEKSTVYDFENEAYRFLEAIRNEKDRAQFPNELKANFYLSLEKSLTETHRMIKHVFELKPCRYNFMKHKFYNWSNFLNANVNLGNIKSKVGSVWEILKGIGSNLYPIEINILLIGESGEAESSWIDAIKNYFQNASSEYNKSNGCWKIDHIVETKSSNKKKMDGDQESQVVKCKIYSFQNISWAINLIYTPATLYYREVEHIKRIIENIFKKLSPFRNIHSICFLLTSKESSLISKVQPIIEVLKKLEQNVSKNITFCYTDISFDKKSEDALKLVPTKNQISDLELTNNTFWFNGVSKNYQYERKEKISRNFSQEARRMFKYISELQPITLISAASKKIGLLSHLARSKSEMVTTGSKPVQITYLFINCIDKNCFPGTKVQWFCSKCTVKILYGFDNMFYCDCGYAAVDTYEFMCLGNGHGQEYKEYANLNEFLSKLEPLKKMNILIIGETGVGKSTWVNGFKNFSAYSSLEDAESNVLLNLIHCKFTLTDNDSNEITVLTGHDSNEIQLSGQSSTQICKTYCFPYERYFITLIDTPGYGDSRGVDQDIKNFKNIFDMLSSFEELSAICILLKPNNRRLDIIFRYSLKELLTYFHRDAAKNILFCFTNSRGTNYKPGDTLPTLRSFLSDCLQGLIKLDKATLYCFDSEPYRYLAAKQNEIQPVQFSEKEKAIYSESWMKSVTETQRFVNYISEIAPHHVQKTKEVIANKYKFLELKKEIFEFQAQHESIIRNKNERKDEENVSSETLQTKSSDKVLKELAKELEATCDYLRKNAIATYNDEETEFKEHYRDIEDGTKGESNT